MVYPALTYLEEIGYAHLVENQAAVDTMFEQFERVGEKMDRVRKAFAGEASPESDTDDTGFFGHGRGHGSKAMMEARGLLKAALMDARHASPEEQKRIVEILKRAAEEIRGKE